MQTVSENGDLHEAELKIIHTVILLASADSYTIWCCRNSFNASLGSRMVFLFSQNNSVELDWIKPGANSDGINTETTLWCVFTRMEKTWRKSKKKRLFASDFPLDHIHRAAIFLWDHDQGGKICSRLQVLKRWWFVRICWDIGSYFKAKFDEPIATAEQQLTLAFNHFLANVDVAKVSLHTNIYFSPIVKTYLMEIKHKCCWTLAVTGDQMCCFLLNYSSMSLQNLTTQHLFSCWSIVKRWNWNDLSDFLHLYNLRRRTQSYNVISAFELPTLSVTSEENILHVNMVYCCRISDICRGQIRTYM